MLKIQELKKSAYHIQQGSLVISNLLQQYRRFFKPQHMFTEHITEGYASFNFANVVHMMMNMPEFQEYCIICGRNVHFDIMLWDADSVFKYIIPILDKELDPNLGYLFGIDINGFIIDTSNTTMFNRLAEEVK